MFRKNDVKQIFCLNRKIASWDVSKYYIILLQIRTFNLKTREKIQVGLLCQYASNSA